MLLSHLLTLITFSPLVGALVCLAVPGANKNAVRRLALAFSLVTFLLTVLLVAAFESGQAGMQFVFEKPWIANWGVSYKVGVDGLSLFLVVLTGFLTPIALLSTWAAVNERVKEFMVFMLVLETGMMGVFVSRDLFLFYVFWELMLIPMYFIIGVWGGPRRVYAAVKFFLYTLAGSVLMLVGILALYFQAGGRSFDLDTIMAADIPARLQLWLFAAFGLSFAIKVPMFPFHTWLPDAHVEAPTAGSIILAAILLKMGTYGFLRFCLPLFPDASLRFVPLMLVLGVIGILYGALVSMVQTDIKKLVAYSSVSHLGFVILGLFAFTAATSEGSVIGIQGALMQMINHGLSTGALFLVVGIIYERTHTRLIEDYGGIAASVPKFAVVFLIVSLSSIGLPGLNGFIGEFLIILGVFKAKKLIAVLAASGVILAAVYLLWMIRRVMFGPITREENRSLKDLTAREYVCVVPLLFFIVFIGVYPGPLLRRMEPSVKAVVERLDAARNRAQLDFAGRDRAAHDLSNRHAFCEQRASLDVAGKDRTAGLVRKDRTVDQAASARFDFADASWVENLTGLAARSAEDRTP